MEAPSPVERLVAELQMIPVPSVQDPDGLPVATHEGTLTIGDVSLKVWQLSNGRRVIDSGDLQRLFGDG